MPWPCNFRIMRIVLIFFSDEPDKPIAVWSLCRSHLKRHIFCKGFLSFLWPVKGSAALLWKRIMTIVINDRLHILCFLLLLSFHCDPWYNYSAYTVWLYKIYSMKVYLFNFIFWMSSTDFKCNLMSYNGTGTFILSHSMLIYNNIEFKTCPYFTMNTTYLHL